MARDTISQLDLILIGQRRNFVRRLLDNERAIQAAAAATSKPQTELRAEVLPELSQSAPLGDTVRPNLLLNSSFEHFNVNATVPDQWVALTGCTLSLVASGGDGYYSVKLVNGQTLKQALAAALPQGSLVVSVAARTVSASQTVVLDVTATSGALTPATTFRVDAYGGVIPTDELPNDGRWYRFYRAYVYAGGGTPTFKVNSGAGTGTIEVDAAKFEFEGGLVTFLEPTAYVSQDIGAAFQMRNFSAENIVAGTLTVGGPSSSNPRLYVRDGAGNLIATIGDTIGGYLGIEILGAAGLKISGAGTLTAANDNVTIDGANGININPGTLQRNHLSFIDPTIGVEAGRVEAAASSGAAALYQTSAAPGSGSGAASVRMSAIGYDFLSSGHSAQVSTNVDDSTPANNRVELVVDNTTIVEAKVALARIFGTTVRVGNGTFGVFAATPVGQQPGGAATAGATYGSTEQTMLQKLYDAARAFGFIA